MAELTTTPDQTSGPGVMLYAGVWLALLALTALTWGIARIDLGAWNLVIALAIATVKSGLVLMFFMHLWHETAVNRMIPLIAIATVILLCSLTALDVKTRFPLAAPPGSLRAMVPTRGQLN